MEKPGHAAGIHAALDALQQNEVQGHSSALVHLELDYNRCLHRVHPQMLPQADQMSVALTSHPARRVVFHAPGPSGFLSFHGWGTVGKEWKALGKAFPGRFQLVPFTQRIPNQINPPRAGRYDDNCTVL